MFFGFSESSATSSTAGAEIEAMGGVSKKLIKIHSSLLVPLRFTRSDNGRRCQFE